MVRFCANVSMLFAEAPFLERFELARAAGFDAVEFQFPYEYEPAAIKLRLDVAGLDLELFNFPPGDSGRGDRGLANDPRRVEEFRASIDLGLEYAAILKPAKMNCMGGKVLVDVDQQLAHETLTDNLRWTADLTQRTGIRLVTEPLNPYDAPDFYMSKPSIGFAVTAAVAHPNLKVEYDIYHAQRTEGNIITTLEEHIDEIGHIQLADSPGRNEPGTGELNFATIFAAIDRLGYTDRIGLEYNPSLKKTVDTLTWMEKTQA